MEPHQYFAIPLFWIFIVALRRRDDAQIFSRAQALSGLLVLSFLPALPPLFAAQHFRCVAVYSRRAPIPAALRSSLELDLWLAPLRNLRHALDPTQMKRPRAHFLRKARRPCSGH